ncbi:molecular chaperone DnaJ, partial [Staphylococcus felis]|nr:molecular chaperone DnaJ [Staphylococcus felis]
HAGAQYGGFGQGFGGQDFSGLGGGGFEDIFSSFFGGSQRQRDPNEPRRGDDLQYTMTVTFEESVFVTEKEISIIKDVTFH